MNDARVVRRDAWHGQHDVAVGGASNEDGLLSEAGDHDGEPTRSSCPGGKVERNPTELHGPLNNHQPTGRPPR